MKNLVIIGGGGMGKEIFYTATNSIGYGTEFIVKGFIDDNIHSMDGFVGYPPVLGTIADYQPIENDVFCCSIGNVQTKRKLCELIRSKGGEFQSIIHKDAQIRNQISIGNGTIVDWNAAIGSNAIIGENCLIQAFACVAHDCRVGDYSRLDVRTLIVGGVKVGDNVTIHTNSVVSHNVTIGNNAIVGAMSFVIRKVKEGVTVQGNPARIIEY